MDSKKGLVEYLTADRCWTMVKTKQYPLKSGKIVDLSLNSVNFFTYFTAGSVEHSGGNIYCKGQSYNTGEMMLKEVVVSENVKVEVWQDIISGDEQVLMAEVAEKLLHCPFSRGYCMMAEETFVWKTQMGDCPRYKVTRDKVQGIWVLSEDKTEVFVSTDGSLIRLKKLQAAAVCGRVLYSTTTDNIMVHELAPGVVPLTQKVEAKEADVFAFIKNRDDFLYHDVRSQMKMQVAHFNHQMCLRDLETSKSKFFLQLQMPALTNVYLGNGIFATAGGETLHTYKCRKVTVQARRDDRCFEGLPIMPFEWRGDKTRALSLSSGNVSVEWFLEPVTHRLTNFGIRQPCSEMFIGKFKNARGNWIEAGNGLRLAPAPKDMADLDSQIIRPSREKAFILNQERDYANGGLYDKKTQEGHRNFNRRLEFFRKMDAYGARMSESVNPAFYQRDGVVQPEELFPDLETSWVASFWDWFESWYYQYGIFCAAVLGLWTACNLLRSIVVLTMRCVLLRELGVSIGAFFMQICCVSVVLARRYRKAKIAELKLAAEQEAKNKDVERGEVGTEVGVPDLEDLRADVLLKQSSTVMGRRPDNL